MSFLNVSILFFQQPRATSLFIVRNLTFLYDFYSKIPVAMLTRLPLCCILAAFLCACATRSSEPAVPYYTMTDAENIADFEGRKVRFLCTLAEIPMAHMMRPSLNHSGKEEHIYIDPLPKYGFGQIVAYFKAASFQRNMMKTNRTYWVSGTVGSVSGAGMGGGTHTEYYLELEGAELVRE